MTALLKTRNRTASIEIAAKMRLPSTSCSKVPGTLLSVSALRITPTSRGADDRGEGRASGHL